MRIHFTEKIERTGKRKIRLSDGSTAKAEAGYSFDAPDEDARRMIDHGLAQALPTQARIEELGEAKITPNQNKKLHAMYNQLEWGDEEKQDYLKKFDVKHTNELTRDQAFVAVEDLSGKTEKREVVTKTTTGEGLVQVQEEAEKPLVLAEPAGSVSEIKEMMDCYEKIVKELLDKRASQRGGDILYINKKGRPTLDPSEAVNTHITRSGLRKLALAMSLDMKSISREKIECEDGAGKYYLWRYTVRVMHPSGRIIERDGACTSRDPFFAIREGRRRPLEEIEEPNIMMKAETVAFNRAILDFVGGVKLGTEEVY